MAAPRVVMYEKVKVSVNDASDPITPAAAKRLLGWITESEGLPLKDDFLLKDGKGLRVKCTNNVTNRPLYMAIVITLVQEILNRKWRLNGESIIIGKTGLVLNGQHTLIALVLAAQEWEEHPGKWKDYWQTEPTIEKLVVFGIDEGDATVNTMDTCKPRTLSDVIYRSVFFAKMKGKDRRYAARYTEHAVKLLWFRTGAKHDAYAPLRTHAESLDFIARHPKLLQCVKHIHEENGDGKIAKYLSPGYAAGLLYLMGSAATDRESEDKKGYSQVDHPSEKQIDWTLWDKAEEFWTLLAAGDKKFNPIRESLGAVLEDGSGSVNVRMAILVKAWNAYAKEGSISDDDVELEFTTDGDGIKTLAETPITGGIDLGVPG